MPLWWVKEDTNYGSLFQAYALQYILKERGFEPIWVQYDITTQNGLLYKFLNMKKQLFRCLRWPERLIGRNTRKRRIAEFKKENSRDFSQFISSKCVVSDEIFSSEEALRDAYKDCYAAIVGSDQMWIHSEAHYFLSFVPAYKRIAYAVSAPWGEKDRFWVQNLREKSQKIPALSVREQAGVQLLHKLGVAHVRQVLDPVLLVNKEIWEELIDESGIGDTAPPYVLGYFLNGFSLADICWDEIQRYKQRYNLAFKAIPNQGTEAFLPSDVMVAPSPVQFLSLFKNCQCVITNSFHAIVFAIIFEKPFVIIPQLRERIHQNARFESILRTLGIQDRMVRRERGIEDIMETVIDYESVAVKLNILRKESLDFLEASLDKLHEKNE